MSELRTWQRRHGERVIAEVRPVPGISTWEASARLTGPPFTEREVGLHFSLLTEAQDAADVLARAMVVHQCDASCDSWTALERRKTPR
jgi:2-methylaconitate cis-trans-isomerase PrpF